MYVIVAKSFPCLRSINQSINQSIDYLIDRPSTSCDFVYQVLERRFGWLVFWHGDWILHASDFVWHHCIAKVCTRILLCWEHVCIINAATCAFHNGSLIFCFFLKTTTTTTVIGRNMPKWLKNDPKELLPRPYCSLGASWIADLLLLLKMSVSIS
jgi:hypothetical protein